jgi:hypothetical protein
MNPKYFGSWKVFQRKREERWGQPILCSRVRPIFENQGSRQP